MNNVHGPLAKLTGSERLKEFKVQKQICGRKKLPQAEKIAI